MRYRYTELRSDRDLKANHTATGGFLHWTDIPGHGLVRLPIKLTFHLRAQAEDCVQQWSTTLKDEEPDNKHPRLPAKAVRECC